MTAAQPDLARRYTHAGRRAHIACTDHYGATGVAHCGIYAPLGAGTQGEYEKAAELPLCRTCARLVGVAE